MFIRRGKLLSENRKICGNEIRNFSILFCGLRLFNVFVTNLDRLVSM
jgi:hypothetical protein